MNLNKVKTLCMPVLCFMALALVIFQAPAQCQAEQIINIAQVRPFLGQERRILGDDAEFHGKGNDRGGQVDLYWKTFAGRE